MRPKQHSTTESGDLLQASLQQIINMKHELVQLAGKIYWAWIDGEIAPHYSDFGLPEIKIRFVAAQARTLARAASLRKALSIRADEDVFAARRNCSSRVSHSGLNHSRRYSE